jgi:RNA-directed DNA polymerase
VLHPNRIYIANRTKGNFYAAIEKQNKVVATIKPESHHIDAFLSSMNSYLGIMKHYKSYRIRKKMIFKNLSQNWWTYVYLSRGVSKFVARKKKFVKG